MPLLHHPDPLDDLPPLDLEPEDPDSAWGASRVAQDAALARAIDLLASGMVRVDEREVRHYAAGLRLADTRVVCDQVVTEPWAPAWWRDLRRAVHPSDRGSQWFRTMIACAQRAEEYRAALLTLASMHPLHPDDGGVVQATIVGATNAASERVRCTLLLRQFHLRHVRTAAHRACIEAP